MSHEFESGPSGEPPALPDYIDTEGWERGPDGLLHRTRIKTVLEVFAEIRAVVGPEPRGAEEGLSVAPWIPADHTWPPGRIVVLAVTGGSEGHYVHVEILADRHCECVGLGKTFQGNDAAWALARRLADLLEV